MVSSGQSCLSPHFLSVTGMFLAKLQINVGDLLVDIRTGSIDNWIVFLCIVFCRFLSSLFWGISADQWWCQICKVEKEEKYYYMRIATGLAWKIGLLEICNNGKFFFELQKLKLKIIKYEIFQPIETPKYIWFIFSENISTNPRHIKYISFIEKIWIFRRFPASFVCYV